MVVGVVRRGRALMRPQHLRGGIAALCAVFGKSRQAYYMRAQVETRWAEEATQVLALMRKIRIRQPDAGGRKLHRHLAAEGVTIGRDRLFDLLRTHRLLVRRHRRTVQTTDSRHGWRTYPNHVQHLVSVAPGQAVVTISMTEQDHVYENAVAERVNGILKQEFGLGEVLPSLAVARRWVAEAVRIYNQERLHMALDYQTPEAVYATAV